MTHTQYTQPRGVVLVEAIVAIGILVTIIGAVLGLTLRSSNVTRVATDQVVATYLAQDVAEWLVAKKRFNDGTLNYWSGITPGAGNFGISTDSALTEGLGVCGNLSGCNLYRTSEGRYTHESGGNTLTPFRRIVEVDDSADYDADVTTTEAVEYTITVSWHTGSHTESFVMRTTLYKQ